MINSILGYSSLDSIVAYHHIQPKSLRDILADLIFLDQQLPKQPYILNLYEDRYYFLLGLLLGIKRNSIQLFPSSITAHTLNYLQKNYPQILVLNHSSVSIDKSEFYDIEVLLGQQSPQTQSQHYQLCDLEIFFSKACLDSEQVVIFTSGSTGNPKPYKKSWQDFIAVGKALKQQFDLSPETQVLATVPAQHMYGLEVSIMMPLVNGLNILSQRPFYPADIESILIRSQKSCILVSTPIHIRACQKSQLKLPFLQLCISATAPLEHQLAKDFEQFQNIPLFEIYGCTEVGVIATRQTAHSQRWHCLADIELTSEAKNAEDIYLRTNRSINTFLLNDYISEINHNSFLLLGRKQDIINIAGKRTSLAYLNHHLLNIQSVEDGCFFQLDIKDDIHQRLVAFIVTNDKNKDFKKQIIARLEEKIEPVFLPRQYYFVKQIPRNTTGKIGYNDMRGLYQTSRAKQQ